MRAFLKSSVKGKSATGVLVLVDRGVTVGVAVGVAVGVCEGMRVLRRVAVATIGLRVATAGAGLFAAGRSGAAPHAASTS